MIEVIQKNFSQNYDQIIHDLRTAHFIAIDCEFSGLFNDKSSLFDTPEKRYDKLRQDLKDFLIIQMGLTTFCYNRIENNFTSSTYSFYLLPASVFHKEKKISCQLDSIEFLCKYDFNFNKLFHDGINYVNELEEYKYLEMLNKENFLSLAYEENIQKYCSQVSDWLASSSEKNEFFLDVSEEKDYFIYLLHLIIRKRFSNIWTFFDVPYNIKIKRLKESEKAEFLKDKEEQINLNKKLYKSILGFTTIMKEIKNLRKPILGHNFFLDLIIMYNQFYGTLPVSYKKFKQEIKKIFPTIYDTKHMSYHLRTLLGKNDRWNSNSLKDLYSYFSHGKGSIMIVYTPLIVPKEKEFFKNKHFHNAGFDSFCTGFCFVKMAHMCLLWDEKSNSFHVTSLSTTSSSLLKAVENFKNHINFPRGQVNFINLDGSDPETVKPSFLLVKGKKNQTLDISKIIEEVARYSCVEILPRNQYTAIMAVLCPKQANKILKHFKNSKEFYVTNHDFYKFSFLEKVPPFLWGSIIIFSGLLFYKYLRQR